MAIDLLLIFGKSGSGKTHICKAFGLDQVISYTTRPKRPLEIDGIEYNFISEKTYNNIPEKNKVAETTFNGYKYFALIGDLINKRVYIVDTSGVIAVQEYLKQNGWDINPIVIYIHCNIFKRIYRMKKRGDSFRSILSRLMYDHKHFQKIKYNYLVKT